MEGYLNLRIAPWMRRLVTRLIAITPAYIVIIFYGEEKTGALLVLSQVVLSLQLGFAVIPLIHFTSDKEKMGVFVIKNWLKITAWLIAAIIVSLNVKLVMQEIEGWLENSEHQMMIWLFVIPISLATGALLLYIAFKPFLDKRRREENILPHGTAVDLSSITTPVYKKIAVTIDFSSVDAKTIQSAVAQGGHNASYLLLHVVETAGAMWYGSDIADREANEDQQALENYATQLKDQGYRSEIKIGYGNPRRTIPEVVNDYNADMLVMGAHGHNWAKDLVFGTTVDTVRHRVNIPVLIVR
jgi:manganese transport protein